MRRLVWLIGMLLGLTLAATAQKTPTVELFGGYSYAHTSVAGTGFNFNGGAGSLNGNINEWFGIEGEFAGYHTGSNGASGSLFTYTVGPKFAYRKDERFTPFVHALFGGAHSGGDLGGDSAFAMKVGGGLDYNATPNVAIRMFQVDYALTKFSDGVNDRQHSVIVSAGIVGRW
jgi:opacity protein-like surface antigen